MKCLVCDSIVLELIGSETEIEALERHYAQNHPKPSLSPRERVEERLRAEGRLIE